LAQRANHEQFRLPPFLTSEHPTPPAISLSRSNHD
jgi:hypothetical protein